MPISTDELEEQMFKTKDLIRTLCDTVYVCMKEQKTMHHIATLCPIIFEQFTKTEQVMEEYIDNCQARG
uniref:hypothetical protein n=1 Tax=Candidatus Scatousia sp. TaxID=3085663 RepID=UPI004025C3A5